MTQTNKETLQAILDAIKEAQKIIIHRHVSPDPDAIGSQVGLAEIIRHNFPEKTVLTAGQGNEGLGFLAEFEGVGKAEYEGALVIVTDTANIERIDGGENIDFDQPLIKIDHHPLDDSYGTIEWVETSASSCSEMIADFYLAFEDELTMPDRAAQLLYAGIVGDTGRFQFPSTTPHTMKVAAELMTYDFVHTDLLNTLYEMKPAVASLTGYVLENLTVEAGVGSIVISDDLLNSLNLTDDDTSAIVNVPSPIQGVMTWGVFVEQEDGTYRCRIRSKGPVINQIAREHGGGGHPLASGAYADNLDEVQTIIAKSKEAVSQFDK